MRGFRKFGEPFKPFGREFGAGAGASLTYAQYVASLNPLLWYSMRATAGATETNRGSGGSGFDASINGGISLGQVGELGANEAHDVDGTTGYYQVTTGAAIQGGQFWYGFLVNPDTAGEGNAGRFYTNGAQTYLRFQAGMILQTLVTGTGNGVATTTTALTAGQWTWVFAAYDDAGTFLGDRKTHIYIGKNGVVSEAAYSANTALTGTFTTPSGNLFIANNSAAAAVTFDGKMDEVVAKYSFPATITDLIGQWTQIVQASGV